MGWGFFDQATYARFNGTVTFPDQYPYDSVTDVQRSVGWVNNANQVAYDFGYLFSTAASRGALVAETGTGLPRLQANHHFDYHFRLWIVPSLFQLNNPQLNVDIPFRIWNTGTGPETFTDILVSGSSVLTFDVSVGDIIQDFEYLLTNMQIGAGEPSIEAIVEFTTTNLVGYLTVIAAISDTFNLIPDVPIKEIWEFKTDVLTNHLGVEQRIALRRYPRIRQEFTFEIIDLRQRREQYNVTRKNIVSQSLVPLYQYSVNLDQPAVIGATKIFLDNSQSNLRANEFVIIVNPTSGELIISKITSVDLDGITLQSPIWFDIDDHWVAAPAINATINDGSGIDMRNVTGQLKINADSFTEPPLLRPNASRTHDTFDGIPWINRRPIITAAENFNFEREIFDNETGVRDINSGWRHPKLSGQRKFLIQRVSDPDEMDYWRSLFDTTRGGQKSFLLSTWFPDLTLVNPNENVRTFSSLIINEGYFPALYWAFETWKRIQIEYPNGTTTQHVITNAVTNEDGTAQIQIAPAIPDLDGYEVIKYISFLMRWKASDRIVLQHWANYSEITFTVFSSDE